MRYYIIITEILKCSLIRKLQNIGIMAIVKLACRGAAINGSDLFSLHWTIERGSSRYTSVYWLRLTVKLYQIIYPRYYNIYVFFSSLYFLPSSISPFIYHWAKTPLSMSHFFNHILVRVLVALDPHRAVQSEEEEDPG